MDISIIIPVYNSESILKNLIERIKKSLKENCPELVYEIIFINDCSSDQSWKIIKESSEKYSFIKGINLTKNFGQHNATMAGLNECAGKKIIIMDDDLQHPPESIFLIYNELFKNDVCYTHYINRQHSKWKKIVSWLNNLVSSFLLNKPLYVYMSSFKGFGRDLLFEITKFKEPEVYLDALILRSAKKVSMISVPHNQRFSGKSNYNFNKLMVLWSNMAVNFSVRPIRLATFFGFMLKIFIRMLKKNTKNKDQYLILEKTYK